MAYTASMLTFMLPGIDRPVVLTGSQLPISHPLSDAQANLQCAFAMAASGVNGVFIAFDRQVFLGSRAVKVRTVGFHAFESVNLPAVGGDRRQRPDAPQGISAGGGAGALPPAQPRQQPGGPGEADPRCGSAAVPDVRPAGLPGAGHRGLRLGGINFIRRDIVSELQHLVERGMVVVVCSQCLYEPTNLTAYEVGRRALDGGMLPAGDMTTEAAVTKLMWLLGQELPPDQVKAQFGRNLHGEVAVPGA